MDILKKDNTFRYQLLGRMQSDCEYYLGFGNGNVNRLWANDVKEQIETMKKLYNSFGIHEKPQFLTWEDILDFEKKMLAYNTDEEIDIYKNQGNHHWIRTHEVSQNNGKDFMFYMVRCSNCGIIGKRKDLQSPIERYGMFKNAKYETCKK